jgi:hypothetical protein
MPGRFPDFALSLKVGWLSGGAGASILAEKERLIKVKKLIALSIISAATFVYAQQRREHMVCPIDGQRMDWDGDQKPGWSNSSCEFSHEAYTNGQRADHKAWASCVEDQ